MAVPLLMATSPGRQLVYRLCAAVAVALLGLGLLAAVMLESVSGTRQSDPAATGLSGADCPATGKDVAGADGDAKAGLQGEQIRNAQAVIATGQEMQVPTRGLVVAIATALQESQLKNVTYGDRDSLGLFQQRPSMGWGTPAQVRDPAYASKQFYSRLLKVPGWQKLPITEAAQAVQKSGFPEAYQQHAQRSVTIVAQLAPSTGTQKVDTSGCNPVRDAASGATKHMLKTALAQQGKPYVWGATGPNAFDCSGLIVYAWKQAGHRVTVRTSQEMHRVSTPVKPGQERPGDLLFSQWDKQEGAPGAAHVLIVVKPGKAVEAPRTGTPVRTRAYDITGEDMKVGRLPKSALPQE